MVRAGTIVILIAATIVLIPSNAAWARQHSRSDSPALHESVGFNDGMSLYGYVRQQPTSSQDPGGREIVVALQHEKAGETNPTIKWKKKNRITREEADYYPTHEEYFRNLAKTWNRKLDAIEAKAKAGKGSTTYSVNGKVVAKGKFLAAVKNARMEVVVLNKECEKAVEGLQQAAKDAGPDGEVLFETHALPPRSIMFKDDVPGRMKFGERYLSDDVVADKLVAPKDKKGARIVMGNCFWRKKRLQQFANRANRRVSGCPNDVHNITPPSPGQSTTQAGGKTNIAFVVKTFHDGQTSRAAPQAPATRPAAGSQPAP